MIFSLQKSRSSLTIADEIDRIAILKLIPKLMKGTHLYEPVVHVHPAKMVVFEADEPLIVETDEELPSLGARRIEVEIMPRKVRVIVYLAVTEWMLEEQTQTRIRKF